MKRIAALTLSIVLIIFLAGCAQKSDLTQNATKNIVQKEGYNPVINPSDFVSEVDNTYFTLTPGSSYFYKTETKNGSESSIVIVTYQTKKILGVDTSEVWDRIWSNGLLIEETLDWYAQDRDGNVWYFGESSKEYDTGGVASTEGSWEAGVDGAKPGIIMKANPKVGDSYRQEYYAGNAEDMGDVVSLGETVNVSYKTFKDCLKTKDWSKIDSTLVEYKYYCPEAGSIVLEVADSGDKTELTNFQKQ